MKRLIILKIGQNKIVLKKKKKVSEKLSHYLIVIVTFLLAALYVLSPANLIVAEYLPFLVNLREKVTCPLLFILPV